MKIILTLFVLISTISYGQNFDKRLLTNYSQQELSEFSPTKLEMLEYALDHATYITDLPKSKEIDLIEIDLKNGGSFSDLNIKIIDKNQYFKVKGEEKMLVVKSEWVLLNEMQNKK